MPEKRRRTASRPAGPPSDRAAAPAADAPAAAAPEVGPRRDDQAEPERPTAQRARPTRRSGGSGRDMDNDRSLRALVSLRGTAINSAQAMRAREAGCPTAADLLAAERDVVIVRRNYVPPEPLVKGRPFKRAAADPADPPRTR